MSSHLILTDIDNTLYDWPRFFAPSFRAMVHALARELDMPEDSLYNEFKAVFAEHSSLEYAFAIQELASVRRLPNDRIRYLVGQGRGAFRSVQRNHLRPYEHVAATLRWLLEQGHFVVAVTNSPLFRAQQRLFDLRLDSWLSGLIAWEGFEPDPHAAVADFVPLTRKRARSRLKKALGIPLAECKPNESHYATALREFGRTASRVWAVGDSLYKDLEPAAKLGIATVWARYGAEFDRRDTDESTLLKITHWSESQIAETFNHNLFQPDYTIQSFEEVKRLVPTLMPTLF